MNKLSIKQIILVVLAGAFYVCGFVFDGAPASVCGFVIAVVLTAYIVHTLPPYFKNESNSKIGSTDQQ